MLTLTAIHYHKKLLNSWLKTKVQLNMIFFVRMCPIFYLQTVSPLYFEYWRKTLALRLIEKFLKTLNKKICISDIQSIKVMPISKES